MSESDSAALCAKEESALLNNEGRLIISVGAWSAEEARRRLWMLARSIDISES